MLLSIDTETHAIVPGRLAPKLVCLSYQIHDGDLGLLLADEAADFFEACLDRGDLLVGHNGPYDWAVLCAYRESLIPKVFKHYEKGLFRDTQIREQLLDIARGRKSINGSTLVFDEKLGDWRKTDYSLKGRKNKDGTAITGKGLVGQYLGRDRSSDVINEQATKYGEMDGLSLDQWPEEYIRYSLDDATDTLDVYLAQAQAHDIPIDGCVPNEIEQTRAHWCLHLASCWGIRTHAERVAELEARVTKKAADVRQQFLDTGILKVKRASAEERREGKVDFWGPHPKKPDEQVAYRYSKDSKVIQARVEAAYEKLGIKPPRTDPTARNPEGQTKADGDTLDQSGDPLLEELSSSGPTNTIIKTFLPTLKRGVEVPINPRFDPLKNTGRPSAADPNVFNIPREGGVRETFMARDGFDLVSVDYDCAELRSHAQVNYWLFGEADAATFFQQNPKGDPHLELAASILGITVEEALARKKAGDPEIKGVRQMCKAVNFGLPGGMGVDRLIESARKGYGVILTREKAMELKRAWEARWREMTKYLKGYISKKTAFGDARLEQMRPDGKPHRVRGGLDYCEAANTLFQGLTSDGAKEAFWRASYESYVDLGTPLFGSRPLLLLYDEIIAEVPSDIAHEAAHRLAQVMRDGMQMWLPDIPVTCEPALMKFWSKGAEAVYENGRLVPWTPKAA